MSDLPKPLVNALNASRSAEQKLLKSNTRLDNAKTNSEKQGIPPIAISPAQGQQLSILCQLIQARHVLEVGTLGGYSTIWFAESSPEVKVTSIEINPKHRDVALENVKDLSNVDIRLGAALDVLPKLAEEGTVFDFIFIDADWDNQQAYFDWAVKLVRKAGCIYVDNVVRQIKESEEEGDSSGWALIDLIKNDDRVTATIIPTVGTHKTDADDLIDGFVLAIKK